MARGIGCARPIVSGKKIWLLVVLATLLYGISDEFHQFFVPGRSFETFDVMADTIGGAIGGTVYLICGFKAKKK